MMKMMKSCLFGASSLWPDCGRKNLNGCILIVFRLTCTVLDEWRLPHGRNGCSGWLSLNGTTTAAAHIFGLSLLRRGETRRTSSSNFGHFITPEPEVVVTPEPPPPQETMPGSFLCLCAMILASAMRWRASMAKVRKTQLTRVPPSFDSRRSYS